MTPKELVLYFGRHYADKTGERYLPTWGRDLKLCKEWLHVFPEERIQDLINLYFEKQERIYSLPFFKVRINDLLQELKHQELTKSKSIEDNESWRFD